MPVTEVIKIFGKPDLVVSGAGFYGDKAWFYRDQGVFVSFANNAVRRIMVLKSSDLKFNNSGLMPNSPLHEFARACGLKKEPKIDNGRGVPNYYLISDDECLCFRGEDIVLSNDYGYMGALAFPEDITTPRY